MCIQITSHNDAKSYRLHTEDFSSGLDSKYFLKYHFQKDTMLIFSKFIHAGIYVFLSFLSSRVKSTQQVDQAGGN